MAFFTFEQNGWPGQTHSNFKEQFITFEANSESEAFERACWFGLEPEEELPDNGGYRWYYGRDWGTARPTGGGYNVEFWGRDRYTIVYLNNNVISSFADDYVAPT